jgi:hypothetical protein
MLENNTQQKDKIKQSLFQEITLEALKNAIQKKNILTLNGQNYVYTHFVNEEEKTKNYYVMETTECVDLKTNVVKTMLVVEDYNLQPLLAVIQTAVIEEQNNLWWLQSLALSKVLNNDAFSNKDLSYDGYTQLIDQEVERRYAVQQQEQQPFMQAAPFMQAQQQQQQNNNIQQPAGLTPEQQMELLINDITVADVKAYITAKSLAASNQSTLYKNTDQQDQNVYYYIGEFNGQHQFMNCKTGSLEENMSAEPVVYDASIFQVSDAFLEAVKTQQINGYLIVYDVIAQKNGVQLQFDASSLQDQILGNEAVQQRLQTLETQAAQQPVAAVPQSLESVMGDLVKIYNNLDKKSVTEAKEKLQVLLVEELQNKHKMLVADATIAAKLLLDDEALVGFKRHKGIMTGKIAGVTVGLATLAPTLAAGIAIAAQTYCGVAILPAAVMQSIGALMAAAPVGVPVVLGILGVVAVLSIVLVTVSIIKNSKQATIGGEVWTKEDVTDPDVLENKLKAISSQFTDIINSSVKAAGQAVATGQAGPAASTTSTQSTVDSAPQVSNSPSATSIGEILQSKTGKQTFVNTVKQSVKSVSNGMPFSQ